MVYYMILHPDSPLYVAGHDESGGRIDINA